MSTTPDPRTLAGAATALVAAVPVAAATRALAGTGTGRALLGLPATVALPTVPAGPALALGLALAAAAVVVLARHVRRFTVPAAAAARAAAAQAASVPVAAVAALRLAGGALPPAAAWALAALATGALAAWWLVRGWRTPTAALPHAEPGQIWWAEVPFEERAGSKDRPALVLSCAGRWATVLMFTSQDKSGRAGYVPVPAHVWRKPGQRSFLRTDRRIRVRREALRRLEGPADPATLAAAADRHRELRTR